MRSTRGDSPRCSCRSGPPRPAPRPKHPHGPGGTRTRTECRGGPTDSWVRKVAITALVRACYGCKTHHVRAAKLGHLRLDVPSAPSTLSWPPMLSMCPAAVCTLVPRTCWCVGRVPGVLVWLCLWVCWCGRAHALFEAAAAEEMPVAALHEVHKGLVLLTARAGHRLLAGRPMLHRRCRRCRRCR
jgi:hypothetical protein